MKLLVIVPCYNEAESIGGVLDDVERHVPGADILVVNDGSTDRSGSIVAERGVLQVALPYNMGIGAAMQAGYRYADEEGYDVAVQVDADGQHDPAEFSRILGPIEDGSADLVIGSRFLGSEGYGSTAARRVGIQLFSGVLSLLIRQRVTDPTSGFRAASRRVIPYFARFYPDDYPEVESLYLTHLAGLRVREIPVSMRPRSGGRSSITPMRSVYYMVKVMLVLAVWLVRERPRLEE